MPVVTPQYVRAPQGSNPALFGGRDVVTDWSAMVSPFVQALSGTFNGGNAQDRYYDAQAAKLEAERLRMGREDQGQVGLAEAFNRAKVDEVFRSELTQDLASTAARAGLDPKQAAGLASLFISGTPEGALPGMTNEQFLVNTRGAAGMGPLDPGQAFDIRRSQGNFDTEQATTRYGDDRRLEGTKYSADSSAGATVQSAKIKAATDKDIASTVQVTTPPPPAVDAQKVRQAVNAALGGTATKPVETGELYNQIVARAYDIYLKNGGNLPAGVAQAIGELSGGTKDEGFGWFNGPDRKVIQPSPNASLADPFVSPEFDRSTTRVTTKTPAAVSAAPKPGLAVGTIVDGYRFKGGNPNDPNAWEPAA